MNIKYLIALPAFLACLSGCTTYQQGHDFDFNCLKGVQPGVTTKEEMISCLGYPMAVNDEVNGDQILHWAYVWANTLGQSNNKRLTMVFDKNGKLVRIPNRTMTQSTYKNY